MRKQITKNVKRVVVKLGSSILTTDSGYLSQAKVKRIVESITTVMKKHKLQIILVSSGAIACGMHVMGLKKRPTELSVLQAAAAVGQGKLMHTYELFFSKKGLHTGQILLTSDGLLHRDRYLNARNTINTLLRLGSVPIVNENDTVATEEIKFGDNDNLAAQVALMSDADLLIILSDVDGFCVTHGKKCEVLHTISSIDLNLTKHLHEVKGGRTVGGMRSKLETGFTLMKVGMPFVIANGTKKGIIESIVSGKEVGTFFYPKAKKKDSKKRWLAFSATSRAAGTIVVDAGAGDALMVRGKSLLPSGVLDCKGDFSFGDAVNITAKDGELIAKGITNFSNQDLLKIKGKKTKQIKELLGETQYDEVIHRDNMIVLG